MSSEPLNNYRDSYKHTKFMTLVPEESGILTGWVGELGTHGSKNILTPISVCIEKKNKCTRFERKAL